LEKALKFAFVLSKCYSLYTENSGVTIIPRKFTNSKGENFFTEVQNAKRLNKLLREVKNNHYAAKQEEKQHSLNNKKK
jgi:hypothetical protein